MTEPDAIPEQHEQAEPDQPRHHHPRQDHEQVYRARRDAAAAERDALAGRAGRVANIRLLAFLAAIGALVWAELRPSMGPIAFGLFALFLVGFFALIVVHSRLRTRERRAAELAAINDEGIARIHRDWDNLPPVREQGPAGHAYAHDLDIFGHGSIVRLMATTGTGVGRDRLHGWILAPAPLADARRRQDAVRELVPMIDFRQDLQVAGRLAGEPGKGSLEEFLAWAEDEPWLVRRPLLVWTARVLPAITIVLLALQIDGVLDRAWWLLPLLLGVGLAALITRKVHRTLDRASLGDASLRDYAGLVERVQAKEFAAAPLREIHDALTAECDARKELERLSWLTELAELRHSGIFYFIIHLVTLWDVHVLWGLERWQARAGRHVREWTEQIAEIDAMCALATLPLEEPGWTFPELAPSGHRIEGHGIAHPLLPATERVPNDVEVGPPGSFLMVTGSNMSGKSTLLRAIGVNAVLALGGGPVCAGRLRVPPLEIRTSMRVEDSLERGVSLFMAELQQLKRVVDAADAADEQRLLLYLLDEILHGTNTAERQVAVREVLAHLLRRPAIGAISTHDLELANAEPLASTVVPVHFRETIQPEGHEPPMTFDYRLRPGIATSTNALKLVRLVGVTGR